MSGKMCIDLSNCFVVTDEEKEDPCKGVFFRYTENNYAYGGKIVLSRQIKMLKSKSCRGCSKCGQLLADVFDGVADCGADHIELPSDLRHGDVVQMSYVIDGTDWETGYVDSYHLKANKVPRS